MCPPRSLSASTLAYSLFNMTGTAVVWGGAVPMEALVGQAHGAGNSRLVRVLLLRALTVCAALCVPVWALWANAGARVWPVNQVFLLCDGVCRYCYR